MQLDYAVIEKLHRQARRARSREVGCMIERAILWVRARLPGANPALRDAVCCPA
jgi:hypothetical protein